MPRNEDFKQKPAGISIFDVGIKPIIDATGIPIDSNRANPELIQDIDIKMGRCPFTKSPSRFNSPKEMSFLERERLIRHYDQVVAMVGQLREPYLDITRLVTKQDKSEPFSVLEARDFMRAVMYLPRYLVNRAEHPAKADRELPPEYILLSNAVSGSLAALEISYSSYNKAHQMSRVVPDHQKMAVAAEESGALEGKKGVCVAGPGQIPNFLRDVIHGPKSPKLVYDFSPYFDPEKEMMGATLFGINVYRADELVEIINRMDSALAADATPYLRRGDRRAVRSFLSEFVNEVKPVLAELNQRQLVVNGALGRDQYGPKINLGFLGARGYGSAMLARQMGFK